MLFLQFLEQTTQSIATTTQGILFTTNVTNVNNSTTATIFSTLLQTTSPVATFPPTSASWPPEQQQTVGPVLHIPPIDNINHGSIDSQPQPVDNSITEQPPSVIHAQNPNVETDLQHPQDFVTPAKGLGNDNNFVNKFGFNPQNRSKLQRVAL